VSALLLILMQADNAVSGETTETTGGGGGGGDFLGILPLFIILFGIMYLFLILPQKQREKKHRAMLSQLKKNDRVVTAGGIHGIISSVKEDSVILKVDDDKDVKITVSMGSIAQVAPRSEEGSEDKK
jgi:preprotein translocase subunit YajC